MKRLIKGSNGEGNDWYILRKDISDEDKSRWENHYKLFWRKVQAVSYLSREES